MSLVTGDNSGCTYDLVWLAAEATGPAPGTRHDRLRVMPGGKSRVWRRQVSMERREGYRFAIEVAPPSVDRIKKVDVERVILKVSILLVRPLDSIYLVV